ncbi:glycerophosphodiester phosphodiesterase [Brachybacterium sp. FME24]|uniref:glycerophosphodiester phosphodiesterase n=1 Tax=Brachybacterium sp. FME24 TaxID=2742605 RepID=UPI001868630B|nr:glycerophosphodiester phosphodiesterase [Brachybacterium sp. FME24]
MSTSWTAPGSTEGTDQPAPDASGDFSGPAPTGPNGSASPHSGPHRELVQDLPLFPLRPLSFGEVFGAAVRIYRLRAKTVLSLAAAVYGVAFVILTVTTGAGMIPLFGDMQAMIDDPTAASTSSFGASDALLTIGSSAITGVVTMLAASLVTVALTYVAIGEATGRSVSGPQMWEQTRRLALPAIAVSFLLGLLSLVVLAVPAVLGALPLILVQEPNVFTIGAILVGLVVGMLAAFWIWARTLLSIPALVVEGTGVLGSIRRSFRMTRGRKLWRVLGVGLVLFLAYIGGTQVITGVFGTVAFIAYLVILLASSMQALVLGMTVLTILSMVGSYLATVMLSPFLSAGFAALYADNRMRHEAWDIELTRQARENWTTDGVR